MTDPVTVRVSWLADELRLDPRTVVFHDHQLHFAVDGVRFVVPWAQVVYVSWRLPVVQPEPDPPVIVRPPSPDPPIDAPGRVRTR